jgi:DNA-binding NarL/FixJ family response regulator
MKKITLLIVDDHTLIREMWSVILNKDPRFSVIGSTGNAEDAILMAKQLNPDVVIMDINLPGMNGIEATQLIRKYAPGTRILGVSLHSLPAYAREMMQKGASGYVTKNSSSEEMLTAIIDVHSGKKYICDEIKRILTDQMMSDDGQPKGLNAISPREIEIIAHIKEGSSSKEIAESLSISVKTVEVHRYNILKKLQLKNSAALVNYINNSQLKFAR